MFCRNPIPVRRRPGQKDADMSGSAARSRPGFETGDRAAACLNTAALKDQRAQHFPAPLHARFSPGKGNACNTGNLPVGKTPYLGKHECRPVFLRQGFQQRHDAVGELPGMVALRHRSWIFVRQLFMPATAVMVGHGVCRNAEKPCGDASRRAKPLKRCERLQIDIVKDVIAGVAVIDALPDVCPEPASVLSPDLVKA